MTPANEIPFVNLTAAHANLQGELEDAALRVLRSGRYLLGRETSEFEQNLARLYGVKHTVGCSNGLDAIRLIIRGYMELGRLKPGDRIIVPANTYIASVLPITEFGLVPVAIDADADTLNLDFRKADDTVRKYSTSGNPVKGIIIVHLYGLPAWNHEICRDWKSKGILILEDNAQAIGAKAMAGPQHLLPTGGLGDASATSFYPTKNIGAIGDAGAVATNDTDLADVVRALANYGSDRRYHNIYRGFNCRMDELQAAFLNVLLGDLPRLSAARRHTAALYSSLIQNPAITLPCAPENSEAVWHQYPIRANNRDALRLYLQQHRIPSDIHYPVPFFRQPCYDGAIAGDFRVTDRLCSTLISLPIQELSDKNTEFIANIINSFETK